MPINQISNSPLMCLQNHKEPLIKRLNKNYAPRIEDAVTRSELAEEQYVALGTLNDLVKNFTKSALNIQNPVINPFDKKMSNITTTDTSRPNNYISVETTPKASKMSFDVRVNAVATASKMIIGKGGTLNIRSVGNMFNGELTVGVDGVNSVVKLNGGESLQQIIDNINNKFADNGVKASAISLKIDGANDNDNDKYNIVISSQELGAKVLTFNWNPNGKFNPFTGLIQPHSGNYLLETLNIPGTEAEITIDGRQIEKQDSNVFKDIMTGVTIKVLAPNISGDVTKTQTVNIGPNTTNDGVIKDIAIFVRAYNDLKIFVAKMTEKSSEKDYADTAVLHNSSAIRKARFLLDSVFDPSINNGGKYKLLSDVGIGLIPAERDEEAPIGTTLLSTVDETKLRNAMDNNYEDFTALFVGALKVTANTAGGSKLALSSMTETLDSKFYNTPMRVEINPGAAPGEVALFPPVQARDRDNNLLTDPNPIPGGLPIPRMVQWGVKVEIPGITDTPTNPGVHNNPIWGTYTRNDTDTFGYIDFKDTDLKGLRLQWDAVNVGPGVAEVFTVNLSQGLADLAYFRSNDLMSEDGKRGTLLIDSEFMHSKVNKLNIEKIKLEDTLETKLNEIEMQFAKIEQMSILNDIFLNAISDIINPSN